MATPSKDIEMEITEQRQNRILTWLTEDTGLSPLQVENTTALLREGATVPFIARYRKERTGELDEVQIRLIEDRLAYFTELEERKLTVLKTIEEQGKLVPELAARIEAVREKTILEDLYLPYKPKRRTKAMIARERGLEPLADRILEQDAGEKSLEGAALPFVDPQKDIEDVAAALEGAGHILAERLSEDPEARANVRRHTWEQGVFCAKLTPDQDVNTSKFQMYEDYREPLKDIPSHRMLAMRRGEKEEVLRLSLEAPEDEILHILRGRLVRGESVFRPFLEEVAFDAYRRLLAPSIEVELRLEARRKADDTAIEVFADNLKNLLLSPPAGGKRVLGVDPGLRTGSKLATVSETGRFLEHATIYPHTGGNRVAQAGKDLLRLIATHRIEMIAIGNGTASREMEQFVRDALKESGLSMPVVMVNEAGASVYSASDIAREEFPDLDITIRGAISIARRLQDPLAELVKIDPKSIGVGQYQHDVNQGRLKKALESVVESCVNYVGVDLNTASHALLNYVSGIGESLARAIVRHRDENGSFTSRKKLLAVPRFGAKAFEQSAGFLRIRSGENPLDNTAVHPERYALVKRMADDLGCTVGDLIEHSERLDGIDLESYATEEAGLPTLRDIVGEIKKPGRDPREEFRTVQFREDIREMQDLREGLLLPGIITNVTAFGAFVDIGVHQDGLVHISHLANRFIKDPNEVVKVGDIVQVKILSVDLPRRRIALSMKEAAPGGADQKKPAPARETKKNAADPRAWEKAGFRVKKR